MLLVYNLFCKLNTFTNVVILNVTCVHSCSSHSEVNDQEKDVKVTSVNTVNFYMQNGASHLVSIFSQA